MSEVVFRPLERADHAAVLALIAESPDTGSITFKPVYKANITDAYTARRGDWRGVIAESGGKAVGLGVVGFEETQLEGKVYPAAYLFSLVVHPAFRRQGIASKLAAWRLERARERVGSDGVIYAHIQKGNEGSLRNSQKWRNQFLEELNTVPVKTLDRPPTPQTGVVIRQAQDGDLDQVAARLNAFYADYHFYTPETAESLRHWLDVKIEGRPVNQYWIATDPQGNLLAGIGATMQTAYMDLHVVKMPTPIRLLNVVMKVVPPDGVLRSIDVHKAWFREGQVEAAHQLWETVRYQSRTIANTITVGFDPRSPITQMFAVPGWMPRARLGMAVHAPVTLSADKLIYASV